MSSAPAFVFAVIILLAVPGPTNSLLFLSGAERGFHASLKLLIGECAGYLAVIVPLAVYASPYLAASPLAAAVLKLTAATWIMYLATKLWRRPSTSEGAASVTVKNVFVTTLLNPKSLVIGLTIMPAGTFIEIAPWIVLFLMLLAMIAVCWIGAGAAAVLAARGRFDPSMVLGRVAGVLLGCFSLIMVSTVVGIL